MSMMHLVPAARMLYGECAENRLQKMEDTVGRYVERSADRKDLQNCPET